MTFTIQSISTGPEAITIRHKLEVCYPVFDEDELRGREQEYTCEEVIIEEIHTESTNLSPSFMEACWEWFDPPSDEFLQVMLESGVTRRGMLDKCRVEIVKKSRGEL